MTTIATDGVSMSSDGRTTAGGGILSERSVKLFRLSDGSVIGAAGEAPESTLAIAAIEAGLQAGTPPVEHDGKFTLLRLMLDGQAWHYHNTNLHGVQVSAPAAIGSGGEYASGAMMMGASSAEAIRIAKKLDAYTGGRVRTLFPKG